MASSLATALQPIVVNPWPAPLGRAAAAGELLGGAARVWSGPRAPGLQVRLFRRTIETPGPIVGAEIEITAASYFHLWVNGQYVSRGPTFHPPERLPVSGLDLSPYWQAGRNVVAVLVFCPGFPTHHVPSGEPGLWAAIRVRSRSGAITRVVTDGTWRVSDRVGWRAHAVRHGYALGPVEVFDAAKHAWGWQERDYDDSGWAMARCLPFDERFEASDMPPMRFGWSPVRELVGAYRVGAEPAPLEPGQACELLGEWLQEEPWTPLAASGPMSLHWDREGGSLTARGLTPEHGLAVVLDLQSEQVGNLRFTAECDSPGTIEIGWSEVMRSGRPEVTHKGTTYVDRLLARAGEQAWEALQFTGLRYLVLILRGFTGSVTLRGAGVRTSSGAPELAASFSSSDSRLTDIWELCARTLRIGTQETVIDCPSREQAPYLGDGNLVGEWLGRFSGDYRHWRYLIQLGFDSQAEDGLMRDAPLMPVRRSLIDYVLLTVIGLRNYRRATGDGAFARKHLEGCRRALGYFDRRVDGRDMLGPSEVAGIRLSVAWDIAGPPRRTEQLDPHVFIDHAGLGGHNVGEPGIERRGRSAALNALYVLACDALADLEADAGNAGAAAARRATAHRVRDATSRAFWDDNRGVFIDALDRGGRPYDQVSEQSNVLAVMAGFPTPTTPAALLRHVLKPDPTIARCGPYFYAYLLPLMAELGMHAQALTLIRQNWGHMLDHGATTLWETFAGDRMDTWCHPWSAAPADFLLRHILGVQTDPDRSTHLTLKPRPDLLPHADGSLPWHGGLVRLYWETRGERVVVGGSLPAGCRGRLYLPGGEAIGVEATWQTELPLPRPD